MPRSTTATKKPAKKAATKRPAPAPDPDPEEDSASNWFVPLEETVDYLNILYYGREGGGKTSNAARMANAADQLGIPSNQGKVLVVNAEGGLKLRALKRRGVNTDRIVVWPDPKRHQRATHAGLDQIFRNIKADLMKDPESWFGVCFDSVSEIHVSILDTVQAKRVKKIADQGKDVDPDFVDISDYGTMSKLFRDVLRKFRDLPCHFVCTALERRDIDKDTGRPQYGPAVTPGLQSDLLGYVDFVLMCKAEDEDGPYRGLTRANSRFRAKDRFDVLPKVMVDPFFDRIMQYVIGELDVDENNDPEQARYTAKGKDVNKSAEADADEEEEEDDD